MTAVLGVDGGGSKTHAAICDENGTLIGAGTAGPSNWETVGLRGASDSIGDAIERALDGTGLRRSELDAAVFGLAGVDWPSDVPRLEGAFEALRLGIAPAIVNDSYIALRAGVRAPWGVVVIAGTGTVAAGRNSAGETYRTLGLGRLLGDEGSASDVGEAALRAVAREYVGRGPATSLSEGLCELMGAATVAQLLEEYSRGGERESNAAPVVLRHADRGDPVAIEIVEWAGAQLGEAARVVASRLAMDRRAVRAGDERRPVPRPQRAARAAHRQRGTDRSADQAGGAAGGGRGADGARAARQPPHVGRARSHRPQPGDGVQIAVRAWL